MLGSGAFVGRVDLCIVFVSRAGRAGQDDSSRRTPAGAPANFELRLGERRCAFIFCNLDAGAAAHRLVADLHLPEASHVDA